MPCVNSRIRQPSLYVDQGRYWYSTQPTVAQLARERADRYEPETVFAEIHKRLQQAGKIRGDFSRVHPCPPDSSQILDELDARLVILGPEFPHRPKDLRSPAQKFCVEARRQRGASPRQYSNSLVFLAADESRLAELIKAVREFLAWESIDKDKESLDLNAFQRNQAATKKKESDDAVKLRIGETYIWLLVPVQENAQADVNIQENRLQGNGDLALAERASRKLISDQLLYTEMEGYNLRHTMDTHPYLWRDSNYVLLKQLIDDFARYIYLPRIKDGQVVIKAVEKAVSTLTWESDGLAYAESFDETKSRYCGLWLVCTAR
jgi:hypothetical protein